MYEYAASLRRVVDADTLDLTIDLGFYVDLRERVRVYGIDAWETRGTEREKGLAASAAVVGLFADTSGDCVIRTHRGKGKYGRWLAEVILEPAEGVEVDLAEWLVEHGHAEWRAY